MAREKRLGKGEKHQKVIEGPKIANLNRRLKAK